MGLCRTAHQVGRPQQSVHPGGTHRITISTSQRAVALVAESRQGTPQTVEATALPTGASLLAVLRLKDSAAGWGLLVGKARRISSMGLGLVAAVEVPHAQETPAPVPTVKVPVQVVEEVEHPKTGLGTLVPVEMVDQAAWRSPFSEHEIRRLQPEDKKDRDVGHTRSPAAT